MTAAVAGYTGAGMGALASLREGHPFAVVLSDDGPTRAAALDALIGMVADSRTRFVRATNPLRAPLTLERLLFQVVAEPGDVTDLTPARVIRQIAARRGTERRVVLVIEQAETIHPDALRFLAQTSAFFPDGDPALQIVFAGRESFRALIEPSGKAIGSVSGERLQAAGPASPASPTTPFPQPPPPSIQAPGPPTQPATPPSYHWTESHTLRAQLRAFRTRGAPALAGVTMLALAGAAAMVFAVRFALYEPPERAVSDFGATPEPASEDRALDLPPALQPGPPADVSAARMRRDFGAYLLASGRPIGTLSLAQQHSAYAEFLEWRTRTGRAAAPTEAPAD